MTCYWELSSSIQRCQEKLLFNIKDQIWKAGIVTDEYTTLGPQLKFILIDFE